MGEGKRTLANLEESETIAAQKRRLEKMFGEKD